MWTGSQTSVHGLSGSHSDIVTISLYLKSYWDVAKTMIKKWSKQNLTQKIFLFCLLMLVCKLWGQEAKLQRMGWVSAILVLHNWGVVENNCRKGEGRKTHPIKSTVASVALCCIGWPIKMTCWLPPCKHIGNARNVNLASHQICWLNHAKQHEMSYQQDVSQHAGGFFWT